MAVKQETLNLSITGDIIDKAVKSFTFSKKYTKVMVKSSILNILYRRISLNEGDLKTKNYKDIPFVVLKRRSVKDPLLCHYVSWVKGIADAIEKNYLKEIFVFLKNAVDDEPIETYRLYLKYNLQENYENRHTSEDLKAATQELLQVLHDLGKSTKLSQNTNVLLELTYLDATPESYQPPGFEDSDSKYCLTSPNCTHHLATLKTGFHKLSYYGAGLVFSEGCMTPVPSQNIVATDTDKTQIGDGNSISDAQELEAEGKEVVNKKTNASEVSVIELNVSNITVSDHCGNVSVLTEKTESVVMTGEHFNCICQLSFSIDVDMISCFVCKRRYHAPCYGYLSEEKASQLLFTCASCNANDQALLQFNKNDWPLLARVRIVLYFMNKNGKFPVNIMKLLSDVDRNKILEKIEAFNLIKKGKQSGKINKVTLRQILSKFFMTDSENSEILC